MKRWIALTLFAVSWMGAAAWSQCNNPTSPGVVICTPTNNSTVVYNNVIEVYSTPAQGATITGLIIYDNNVKVFQDSGVRSLDLVDAAILNGEHHVVVNVWDSDGNLYQAKTNFYVTGLGYAPCPVPRSPGVVICNPPAGGIYSTGPTVYATARGQSPIKNTSFYLNGKLVQTLNGQGGSIGVQLSGQNINNTLKVVATDSSGKRYSASKILNAKYTYAEYFCFFTCTPGINVIAPQVHGNVTYVGNTFNLNAQILSNPKPIASMKAYIDNSVVATSSGPSLQAEVSGAPDGTHILTIQGWDDTGIEYRVQENININVHN